MRRAHFPYSAYVLVLASLVPACKDDAPSDGDGSESTGSESGETGDGEPLYSGKPSVCIDCHDNRKDYSDWVYSFELPR